jgi:FAD/FMN-containing dehydrogenase
MNPIDELQAQLGADCVLTRMEDTAPFLTDWRGRFTGKARAVVLPRSTQQVSQALAWCHRHRVPAVPQGGNSGLAGGATPDASGTAIVIGTRRMNRIREIDPANDSMIVEAGCILQHVQEAAAAHERLFPLSVAAQGTCTIGGNLATNAGGTQVLRYGNARELTLGLEVVLGDGQVWNGLRALRKDNSGYDLKQLFLGSEGTLGVITAASLRLFARPKARVVCLVALADIGAAIRLLQRARDESGPALTGFELMSQDCIGLVVRTIPGQRAPFVHQYPWVALLEVVDHESEANAMRRCERLVGAAIEAQDAIDAVVSQSVADGDAFWGLRESIPMAQAKDGGNVKHDISLPLKAMERFVEDTTRALLAFCPDLLPLVFGHLGDGNLHFNIAGRNGAQTAFDREERINEIVFDAVVQHGGSISAEHGLGQLRRTLAQRVKNPLELEMMRRIKMALDPFGLMNPGKVI